MTGNKFPQNERTFETRLKFIAEIFNECYSQTDIMAHCIAHKLDRSFLLYDEELAKSVKRLTKDGSLKLLKKLKNL